MKNLLFSLFLCSGFVYCQHNVLDSTTKEIIPYPLVSIPKIKTSFYGNEKGIFELKKKIKNDTVIISCLGYENYKQKVCLLPETIYLKPKFQYLDEVVINQKPKKIKEIGFFKRTSLNWFINSKTQFGILIIPQKKDIASNIEKISFPITTKRLGKKKDKFNSIFKVQIFKNDSIFSVPILESPIIINCNQDSNRLVTINLSDENIPFFKEGLFVTIEMIGELDKNKQVKSIKNPLPAFGFTNKKAKGFKSKQYYKTTFSNKWKEMDFKSLPFKTDYTLAIRLSVSVNEL